MSNSRVISWLQGPPTLVITGDSESVVNFPSNVPVAKAAPCEALTRRIGGSNRIAIQCLSGLGLPTTKWMWRGQEPAHRSKVASVPKAKHLRHYGAWGGPEHSRFLIGGSPRSAESCVQVLRKKKGKFLPLCGTAVSLQAMQKRQKSECYMRSVGHSCLWNLAL